MSLRRRRRPSQVNFQAQDLAPSGNATLTPAEGNLPKSAVSPLPSIEFMSDREHLSQRLPVDDSIIIKLPEKTNIFFNSFSIFNARNSPLYISTKDFVDKVAGLIFEQVQPPEVYQHGTKVEILEPEKKWVSGKFRLRLVFGFIPDEAENNTPDKFVSP